MPNESGQRGGGSGGGEYWGGHGNREGWEEEREAEDWKEGEEKLINLMISIFYLLFLLHMYITPKMQITVTNITI